MSVPPALIKKMLDLVVRLARTAVRGATLVRKTDQLRVGDYLIEIIRRNTLGRDGGTSQMVYIYRNGVRKAVWHIVTKAGKIIHKDIKSILK